MARIYADEDFSLPVARILRGLGHDVRTVQEAGMWGSPYPAVLAQAVADGRVVLTFNRPHSIRIHRGDGQHLGILVCTRDDDVAALALRIHDAIPACPDMDGQLIRVNRPNGRP